MSKRVDIEHDGEILAVSSQKIDVMITQHSACAGCHAVGACTVADKSDKEISIYEWDGSFVVGDSVVVTGASNFGLQAVFLGYVLPLIILFIVAFTASSMVGEFSVAIFSLLSLAIYYAILYLYRDKIKKKIVFRIKKR